MTETATTVRILGIAGSLRAASFNRMALKAAGELLPPDCTWETAEIGELPLFNQDIELAAARAGGRASRQRWRAPTRCCSFRPSTTTRSPAR